MTERAPPRSTARTIRILLWVLVALAAAGAAALLLIPRKPLVSPPATTTAATPASFGGPFTLLDGTGKAFSSQALAGKPYAIYFGFTRCGDVCPTTLARLVKLRRQVASDQALRIVFVTIDPANDGPKEVGQYAGLFNAPIIGLTGTKAQIDQVKKQFGIFAEPAPHAAMGKEMDHTATVLLFDRAGKFVGRIAPDESDAAAAAKLKALVG